jgi:hypothetical protein
MAFEIDHHDFTNSVNYDELCAGVPWAEGLGKGDFRKAGKSRLSD